MRCFLLFLAVTHTKIFRLICLKHRWVKRQRHQYNLMMEKKTSTLTRERIKLLENIGFVWNCLETAWEQHFQDLHHFILRTGHW